MMSSNRAEEWKKIANDLYLALQKANRFCAECDHAHDQYHGASDPCPVESQIDQAMINHMTKLIHEKVSL